MTPVLGEIVGWELLLVLLLIALLFGSSKLPGLARSMGQATKEFRKGIEDGANDDDAKADTKRMTTPPPSRSTRRSRQARQSEPEASAAPHFVWREQPSGGIGPASVRRSEPWPEPKAESGQAVSSRPNLVR